MNFVVEISTWSQQSSLAFPCRCLWKKGLQCSFVSVTYCRCLLCFLCLPVLPVHGATPGPAVREAHLETKSMDSCSRAENSWRGGGGGGWAAVVVKKQEHWARSFRELLLAPESPVLNMASEKVQLSKACVCPGVCGVTSPVLRWVGVEMRAVCTTTGKTCSIRFCPFSRTLASGR